MNYCSCEGINFLQYDFVKIEPTVLLIEKNSILFILIVYFRMNEVIYKLFKNFSLIL
jgi:hypothetical protein